VDRLRASGTVLSVVETSKEAGSWSSVARATGGSAVVSTPQAVADAFDALDRTLRSSYVISFTPPAGVTSVDLRVQASGRTLTARVPLGSTSTTRSASGSPSKGTPRDGGSTGGGAVSAHPLTWPVLAGLAAVVVAVALFLLRTRTALVRDESPGSRSDENARPASPRPARPGVRAVEGSPPRATVDVERTTTQAAEATTQGPETVEAGGQAARPALGRALAMSVLAPHEAAPPSTDALVDRAQSVPVPQGGELAPAGPSRLSFRQEALAARADREPSGAPLLLARWPRWFYLGLVTMLVAGIVFGFTARTTRTVSGTAAVDVDRRAFTAALPPAAASEVTSGQSVVLDVPGGTASDYAARVTGTTIVDETDGSSSVGGVPGVKPGDVLVTGELVPPAPAAASGGTPPAARQATGRATVVLGSDRLLTVVLGGFRDLLSGG
jgi:hypothetical protein